MRTFNVYRMSATEWTAPANNSISFKYNRREDKFQIRIRQDSSLRTYNFPTGKSLIFFYKKGMSESTISQLGATNGLLLKGIPLSDLLEVTGPTSLPAINNSSYTSKKIANLQMGHIVGANSGYCAGAVLAEYLHILPSSEYAQWCKSGGLQNSITVISINASGQFSATNLTPPEIHKETVFKFKNPAGEISNSYTITYGEKNNYGGKANGFYYSHGIFKKGSLISGGTPVYAIYYTTTLQQYGPASDIETIANKYFSSKDKDNLQCIITTGVQQDGQAYQLLSESQMREYNKDSSKYDVETSRYAGYESLLDNSTFNFSGYVAPGGQSNAAVSYLTNLNAYDLKFCNGIDKRSGKNSNTNYHLNKIDGRNTLYVFTKYNAEITNKTNIEVLQELDKQEYLSLEEFGKVIDNLQSFTPVATKSTFWNALRTPPIYLEVVDENNTSIALEKYFSLGDEKKNCSFKYYSQEYNETTHQFNRTLLDDFDSFLEFLSKNNNAWSHGSYAQTLDAILYINEDALRTNLNLTSIELFEAFTRGHDFLQETYTTVRPQEQDSDGHRLISYNSNYLQYKYSGRPYYMSTNFGLAHEKDLLLETDVTLGNTYAKQTYFIEAIKYLEDGIYKYKDTFKAKNLLDLIDSTQYTEDDYEVITSEINLNQCPHYRPAEATYENNWCDCSYNASSPEKECIYQKMGVCPYLFTSEKHPRRIRTLEQSKSNRFNLIQEVSKVFECYPNFYIEYEDNGRTKINEEGKMLKHIYYSTEKGAEKYAGFRYEKNLSSISRSIDSSEITTKLYVEDVDSELSETGLCSIKTAQDNVGKDSCIYDFSYYTNKGLLNAEQVQRDIWGIDSSDFAYIPRIGIYNKRYDELTELIQVLTGKDMSELSKIVEVDVLGVASALEERKKVAQKLYQFKTTDQKFSSISGATITTDYTLSDSYLDQLYKYREQATILFGLIEDLFFTNNYFMYCYVNNSGIPTFIKINLNNLDLSTTLGSIISKYLAEYCKGELWWKLEFEGFEDENWTPPFANWPEFKELVIDKNLYPTTGLMGQQTQIYNQIKYWKKERAKVLNKINDLASQFYKKYEPYIKEGTWTDSNYLTDNEYYWAACDVLNDSSKPKTSYNISVIDISPLKEFEDDYTFDLGDTTYLEDIDFFGINQLTGLPNRQKVILFEIDEGLDDPSSNTINVQNYSTQFEDLFESITASVQSLTYNENTYKRASNFTAKQYVQKDSLQGTLSDGNLTLLDSNNSNLILDDNGTEGSNISNSASKYKLSGEGLFFSTDGGETWDLGVGPQGWNLDYAKFGSIDASKVQIIDGKYIYFLWDKNGINAYRNPATSTNGLVDFARFNKYGLSLIENGHVRLRAGYEFRNNSLGDNLSGDYSSELPLTDQNVGFYLYNDNGQPIFKTETASEYNDTSTDYSARLSLKGEMFITNANLSSNQIQTGKSLQTSTAFNLKKGYVFNTIDAYRLINTIHSNTGIYSLVSSNLLTEITLEAGETFTGDIYKSGNNTTITESFLQINEDNLTKKNSYVEHSVIWWYGQITNNTDNTIIISLDDSNFQKILDENLEDCLVSGTQSEIIVEMVDNKQRSKEVVLILDHIDDVQYTTMTPVSTTTITYYDGDTYEKQTASLYYYSASINAELYNYWEVSTETKVETESTDTETKEVSIFINNKVNINQSDNTTFTNSTSDSAAIEANSGNERVFMISLKGMKDNEDSKSATPVLKNIITALKNGMLYIGGEIKSELGTDISQLPMNQIPDRVSIVDASMIVTNDGYIWMDWSKVYNISNGQLMSGEGSMMDWLQSFGDYLSNLSSSNGIEVSGYYIEDPLGGD